MKIKLSAFIGLFLILFLPFSLYSNNDEIGETVDEYGTRWSPVTIRDKDTDW